MDRKDLPDPDWRRTEIVKFARRMLTSCDPCPVCGSMVCGTNQKADHTTFHQAINQTKNRLDNAIDALTSLTNRVTSLEARVTAIETRLPPI